MKKVLAIIFACALVIMCCACSTSSNTADGETVEDMVKEAAEFSVRKEILINYTSHVPTITTSIDSNNGNTYYVSGSVTVRDKHGDPYSGTYDAVVEYDSTANDCEVTSFELGKLYKD